MCSYAGADPGVTLRLVGGLLTRLRIYPEGAF